MGQRILQRVPSVYAVCILQLCISLVATAAWYEEGVVATYSAFIGGLIGAVPQAYFTYRVFAKHGARAMPSIVKAFYSGEARKLLLTASLFIIVFTVVKPLHAVALLTTFFLTQVAHLWALFLLRH